jgi:hypothetical protein
MRARQRGLSLLETTAGLSIGAVVLIVAVPVLLRELRASHQAEAREGLVRIAEGASAYARAPKHRHALPEGVARTPAEVPRGTTVTLAEEAWAPWKPLGGAPVPLGLAQRYAYSFVRTKEEPNAFVALAEGDLDGDGVVARASLRGTVDASGAVTLAPDVEFVDALE